ncbi:hypothetical protein Drorol1_Dr00026251 [Drosera rotundifolia]
MLVPQVNFAVDEQNAIEVICLIGLIILDPLPQFQPHPYLNIMSFDYLVQGTKMELIKSVKAMEQLVSGVLYYHTIEVKDDDGNLIIFQAKTYKSFPNTMLQPF